MTELIEKIAAVNEMITTAKKRSERALSDAKFFKSKDMFSPYRGRLNKSIILTAVADRLTRYRNNLIKQLSAMIADSSNIMYKFKVGGKTIKTTTNEATAKLTAKDYPDAIVEVIDNGELIDKQLAKDIFNP